MRKSNGNEEGLKEQHIKTGEENCLKFVHVVVINYANKCQLLTSIRPVLLNIS